MSLLPLLRPLLARLKSRWRPDAALAQPGLYHYEKTAPGERRRIHLRIDPDASGLLLVNASRVLHLNPTAALMARLALEETPPDQAARRLSHCFRVSEPHARADYTAFTTQLDELLNPEGACPVHDLNVEVAPPFSARPAAPYRMDLALTYRCNNDCSHCYNARPRRFPELSTLQWFGLLDRLWEIGIPHVVFTGGEPTMRNDLPALIAHAERNGQITGLNTNGRRLSDRGYLDELVSAGLDHVQITLESHDPTIHDQLVQANGAWKQTCAGLRNALDSPLFVMTNTTMLQANSPSLGATLDFLAQQGVPTIGLNSLIYSGRGQTVGTGLVEADLVPLLDLARQRTAAAGQRLIWYTPTQYCHFDPMQLELGVKGCTAALYNMCLEPDGSVLPCQSYYQPVGNLLSDDWQAIWHHPLCESLRERRYIPPTCQGCALLSECGGGCPLRLTGPNP
jgi:radical SAM protein with 4Fe4S-binding SPASM domain